MTIEEKVAELKTAIAPDTDTEEVLTGMLLDAEAEILNRMYPFGYKDDVSLPQRYDRLQIRLATELYTHRGAEGQASHMENGVSLWKINFNNTVAGGASPSNNTR